MFQFASRVSHRRLDGLGGTNRPVFNCRYCDVVYVTEERRDWHMAGHAHRYRFACRMCPFANSEKESFGRHISNHPGYADAATGTKPDGSHMDTNVMSSDCPNDGSSCKTATASGGERGSYQCRHCSFESFSKAAVTVHSQQVHIPGYQQTCSICGDSIPTRMAAIVHLEQRHVVNEFVAPLRLTSAELREGTKFRDRPAPAAGKGEPKLAPPASATAPARQLISRGACGSAGDVDDGYDSDATIPWEGGEVGGTESSPCWCLGGGSGSSGSSGSSSGMNSSSSSGNNDVVGSTNNSSTSCSSADCGPVRVRAGKLKRLRVPSAATDRLSDDMSSGVDEGSSCKRAAASSGSTGFGCGGDDILAREALWFLAAPSTWSEHDWVL